MRFEEDGVTLRTASASTDWADKFVRKPDPVNHPPHYTSDPSGVECIQIAEHRNFCIGNALKYLWRAGLKGSADKTPLAKQLEDLKKARWYVDREIQRLESTVPEQATPSI